ncbi:MAG: hypothetical protein A07HR60_01158 [uncultured archaeon A07HR60]|nr:MAG: hypothetical protein A07HR60_01158 [uncultured archaeon A07HR60]
MRQLPTRKRVGLLVDSHVSCSTGRKPHVRFFLKTGFLRWLPAGESEGLVQYPQLRGRLTDCPSHRPLLGLEDVSYTPY